MTDQIENMERLALLKQVAEGKVTPEEAATQLQNEAMQRIFLPPDSVFDKCAHSNNPLEQFYYYNRPNEWDKTAKSQFRKMLKKALRYVINTK